MNRNTRVLLSAGLLSSFVLAVFDLLFPLYLQERGVSLVDMGLIFSASTLAISFLGIFVGEYADVHGRQRIYIASCSISAVAKSLFPVSAARLEVLGNKFLHDLQETLRNTVHNVMLYESSRKEYGKLLAWFTTSNFVIQALGSVTFAFLLAFMGYSGCFFLLAGVEVIKLLVVLAYREDRQGGGERKVSLKEAYSFRIDRNLKILSACSAIAALGFGIAHGFLLPLYLIGRYGLDTTGMSIVTAAHRLAFMTTPLADTVIRRLGTRRTYVLSSLAYAASFLTVGLVPLPILVFVPVFLIHDLVGGGIGMTATSVIVQGLTSDSRRGREVNAYTAMQTPMTIAAPVIAGVLAAASWDLIFIAGGLLYLLSLTVFILFFKQNLNLA